MVVFKQSSKDKVCGVDYFTKELFAKEFSKNGLEFHISLRAFRIQLAGRKLSFKLVQEMMMKWILRN